MEEGIQLNLPFWQRDVLAHTILAFPFCFWQPDDTNRLEIIIKTSKKVSITKVTLVSITN